MERRVLLAIFLAFLVLYAWQAMFVKPTPPKPGTPGAPAATTANAPAGSTSSVTPEAAAAPAAAPTPEAPRAETLVGDKQERDVTVETDRVTAVFTNKGARLKSWRVKHYKNRQGEPQELIEPAANQPLPFSLRTQDEPVDATVNGSLYTVVDAPVGTITAPVDLRFEYRDAAGVHAVKVFHLEPNSYVVSLRADVKSGDRTLSPAIVWGPAIGDAADASSYTQKAGGLLYSNGNVQRLAASDLTTQPDYQGEFKYAGVDDNYFMTVALDLAAAAKVHYQPLTITPQAPATGPPRELVSYEVQPGTQGQATRFFVGPKDFDILSMLGPEMPKAIYFGMFEIIVVPLLRSLKWVNSFVGNYGFSIIILTILINVIMFPLRHKSVVSMRKMQEIQPEVKAIQDRYSKLKATDPAKQKMNQELMALYRDRGVNPAGGCVPMLLTMPVLLAMWALLSVAIELRGAPFIGWIHDLTAHDPLYITPVIMGASQFWQQKMTPSAGMDPAQQRMMLMMPIIFTVMFLWLPAGVAIYYAVTNLWGIGQQYLTNYLIGPPKVRTIRPPAERRVKRAGVPEEKS